MMTSDDISRIAQQHAQLMEQSRAMAGNIGVMSATPAPPPEMVPGFSAAAGQAATSGAIGLANAGIAGAGLLGMAGGFGMLGAVGRPLGVLDPFTGAMGAASMGWSAGGGLKALAGGSSAPIARALGAGSLAMGGYMAAGSAFNMMTEQVTRGAQEQMQLTQAMSMSANRASMPSMSFGEGQHRQMATTLRQMYTGMNSSAAELGGFAQAGMNAGMYSGVSSVGQFGARTQELMGQANAATAVFGLQDRQQAFQMAGQAQQMGFYGQGALSTAVNIGLTGLSSGISGGAMMGVGSGGAGVASGFGRSRRQGAEVAMGLASRLSSGFRGGGLDATRMQDMMGGASLEEGVGGLAASLTQGAYTAAFDTSTLMGLVDPDTGHIDAGRGAAFASGMISSTDMKKRARSNRSDRSARMAVQARRGGLASELMEMGSPEELMAGSARAEMNSRGIRSGESVDDVMNIALQKYGNMGEEQANLVRELISAGPSIKADISTRMQETIRSQQAAKPNMGTIESLKKKLADKFMEPWAAPMRDLGASISNWGSDLADQATSALFGAESTPMRAVSAGGHQLARGMRNGADASYMKGAPSGRGGMNLFGEQWAFKNDRSNFGESGGIVGDIGVDGVAGVLTAGASALGTVGAAGLTMGGAALMKSANFSVGGAVRGVAGGAMSLAGSAARMMFNPVTAAIGTVATMGFAGSYMGSADNRGTVSAAYANNMERLGIGGGNVAHGRGTFGVEEDKISWGEGFTDSIMNFGDFDRKDVVHRRNIDAEAVADSRTLLEARMSPGAGLKTQFGDNEKDIQGFIKLAQSRKGEIRTAQARGGGADAMWGALGTGAAPYQKAIDARRAGRGSKEYSLGTTHRGDNVGYLAAIEAAIPGMVEMGDMTDSLERTGPGGLNLGVGGRMGMLLGELDPNEKVLKDAVGGHKEALAAIDGAAPIIDKISSFFGGGELGTEASNAAKRITDIVGEKKMVHGKEQTLLDRGKSMEGELTSLMERGGAVGDSVMDYRKALVANLNANKKDSKLSQEEKTATRTALKAAQETVIGLAGSSMGPDLTRAWTSDSQRGGEEFLGILNSKAMEVALPGIEAHKTRMADDRRNLNRFTVGGTEANAMQARMGGPAFNIMKKALEGSIEGTEAGDEALARASLGMNVNQRGSAMEMMNANQQAVVARSSHVYESMTNKKHNKGQQILGGLMQLEGAMDGEVMNQDFTTGILKRVNAGKGLSAGDMDGIDRLLKAHKVSGDDIEKAKGQLRTMAGGGSSKEDREARATAAKEFAVITGGAGGKIGSGGGGGKGGDMTANIDAFNVAIGKAATVISEAAAGKNMSGPA